MVSTPDFRYHHQPMEHSTPSQQRGVNVNQRQRQKMHSSHPPHQNPHHQHHQHQQHQHRQAVANPSPFHNNNCMRYATHE